MRYVNTVELLLASLIGSAIAANAGAETLYKLVAPDGKVTYVQEPPKSFNGKVIRLDIDTQANTAPGRRPSGVSNEEVIRSTPDAGRIDPLKAAQAKAQAARKAYETARDNPGEGDVQRVGNVRGGARPVFSDEYQKKLDKLEAEMKSADAEVEKLERGR